MLINFLTKSDESVSQNRLCYTYLVFLMFLYQKIHQYYQTERHFLNVLTSNVNSGILCQCSEYCIEYERCKLIVTLFLPI